MVNIAKRMRSFQPLLNLRHGEGASILPPPPAPQLTLVNLQLPQGPFHPQINGARKFWHEHLQRLKYHNPSLPIKVDRPQGTIKSPITLTLQFEGTNPDTLKAIAKKSPTLPWPGSKKHQELQSLKLTEEEKYEQIKRQSPNWRHNQEINEELGTKQEGQQEESITTSIPSADDDDVVLKVNNTTDTDQSTTPPIYTRKTTLSLRGRGKSDIWKWFEYRTQCIPVSPDPKDVELKAELDQFFEKAQVDRERVKRGIDAMKKEKEDLKRAREAAEKMTSEA